MSRPALRNRTVFLLVLGASLAAAMLPVLWPHLDIAVAAISCSPRHPSIPRNGDGSISSTNTRPTLFRGLAMTFIAAWIVISLLRRWRRAGLALAFVGISLMLGPGFVTWAVKEHTLRARPFDVVEFGGNRQFTPALEPGRTMHGQLRLHQRPCGLRFLLRFADAARSAPALVLDRHRAGGGLAGRRGRACRSGRTG